MRDILIGAVTIALGILLAASCVAGVWHLNRPASNISIDLNKYVCVTDGKTVDCVRD